MRRLLLVALAAVTLTVAQAVPAADMNKTLRVGFSVRARAACQVALADDPDHAAVEIRRLE